MPSRPPPKRAAQLTGKIRADAQIHKAGRNSRGYRNNPAVRLERHRADPGTAEGLGRGPGAHSCRGKGRGRAAGAGTRGAQSRSWVRTLDPMAAGGWEFRGVDGDGQWATFSSTHQIKRSGPVVTLWLRQEYAEPQTGGGGRYLSVVDKSQYDCKKQQTRNLLIIYYPANNIRGDAQTEDSDPKTTPWNPIIPGTHPESILLWACALGQARGGSR
jgi:hypothetical protein